MGYRMNKGLRNELITLLGIGTVAALALRKPRAAGALGLGAAVLAVAVSQKKTSFRQKNVIITGGSRGLGLALAQELIREGARVTLIARDAKELERARHNLLSINPNAKVLTITGDVTKKEDMERAISEVVIQWGGIDLLINNAGAILVGPFDSLRREDFQAQLELHLFAVMQAVQMVLPHFRKQKSGRILNICSMGGKVAVPHMLPYDTSKFALAGFSQGLAAELRQEGITVTTVYPTLMNTGSPIQAVFKGDYEQEYAWFAAGDNLPGVAMNARVAARKIIQAARDGKAEFNPSAMGQLRIGMAVIFPELMAWTMGLMNRMMPQGKGSEYHTGADSRGYYDTKSWSYFLRQRAKRVEQQYNQHPKTDAKFNIGLLH